MGRHNSTGGRPLSSADIAVLAELLDECLATRLDIDTPTKTSQYTTVTAWVKQVAIPYFHKMRETTPAEDKQIQTWYKNQCSKHNVSVRRKPVDPEHTEEPDACRTGSTSDKLPSVRQFVIQEYKAEISQLAKEPDGTQPTNYMRRWNQAVTRRVEMLSPNEREVLQAKVDEEMARRARPPTRAEVLASQDKLCAEASEAVHGLLGWGRKQHGDAICFMTMVYRDYSNEIQERTFFISNENDSIAHCKPFKERYDNLMSGHLAAYADSALPKHDVFASILPLILLGYPRPVTPPHFSPGPSGLLPTASPSEPHPATPPGFPPPCFSSGLLPATPLPELRPAMTPGIPPPHSSPGPNDLLPIASLPEPRPATPPQISPGPSGLLPTASLPELRPATPPGVPPPHFPPCSNVLLPTASLPEPRPATPPQISPGPSGLLPATPLPELRPAMTPGVPPPHFPPCSNVLLPTASLPEPRPATPPQISPGPSGLLPTASLPELRPATPPGPRSLSLARLRPPQISPGPSGLPLPSSPGIATQPAVLRTAETRKPRQKRGNLPQQAIRTSTRSTRPPKRAGPLTENNQAPRTKVPVKQRWAYVSEEENQNSPQPPQKKSRRR
ncbi:hypothetical protein Agabi119p4_2653 [Agaricus bisporus var. burnettii]|uniref:Uncharacterized protein n=1 Tax=Agaricus bisporus var. burnettii TaxID=192524 RepID=A0A8H7F9N6_AGABI|nr:hypothetical protein Agabi119p4_2653 [Agaricus bisporus var. burnettii]